MCARGLCGPGFRGCGGGSPAEHHLDDAFLDAGFDLHIAHGETIAQDGGPVADRGDFGELREDRSRIARRRPERGPPRYAVNKIGRQRGRKFVKEEDIGFDGQSAGKPTMRKEASGRERIISSGERSGRPLSADPMAERLERSIAKAQVVSDGKVGDEGRFLIDRQ